MELCKKYKVIEHIRYGINSEERERVFVIPNFEGIPDMKKVLCLSDTSLLIWNLVNEQRSCSDIIDEVVRTYGKEEKEITRDVHEFLNALIDNGYLSVME